LALCLLLGAGAARAEITEYADQDGRVTHYKYTDRKGGIVFTDNLGSIPDDVRKRQKIVRVGPAAPKTDAAPRAAPAEAAAPAAPQAPAVPFAIPTAVPAPEQSSGFPVAAAVALGVAALAGGGFLVRFLMSRSPGAAARPGSERPAASRPDSRRRPETGHGAREPRGAEELSPAQRHREAVKRAVAARDFAAAGRLCEAQGESEEAAGYYRQAGSLAKAGELYVAVKDFRSAAEAFEGAGDAARAAELYAAAFQRGGPESRGGAGGDSALKAGKLYEKAGDADRALAVYAAAQLFAEAAALHEQKGDFLHAAECHVKAGNAERAAELFERGGDPAKAWGMMSESLYRQGRVAEAAGYAEKAGDAMRAAEMYQEVRDYARAGALFLAAGLSDEAGESFALAGDQAGAAEAYERSGRYLQAAEARERLGAEPLRLAALYEKGEDFYAAGRFYVKGGQMDQALNALQQVDPESENARSAALLIGMIFLKKGMTKLAQEKLLKIIDGKPIGKANLDPYYFLALCHERSGEPQKAKAIFEQILVEDYNFRDVRRRLAGPAPAAG
jgi:tetratricopeptide (TPR) repeat protein